MKDQICKDSKTVRAVTVNGEEVESNGTINLVWKLAPNENRVFRSTFFILPGVRHLDVILGQDTLRNEGLLSINLRKLIAPFTTYKPLSKGQSVLVFQVFHFISDHNHQVKSLPSRTRRRSRNGKNKRWRLDDWRHNSNKLQSIHQSNNRNIDLLSDKWRHTLSLLPWYYQKASLLRPIYTALKY
jgi:hypothetical protein